MDTDSIVASAVRLSDPFTLEVAFEYPGRLARYFLEDRFRARYSVPIDSVPESLLVIPFLSSILPFAWLFDAVVEVETVDAVFVTAAEEVRSGFAALYPALDFAGGLHALRTEIAPAPPREGSAMLFSGGLDSIVTYARHAREAPLLITINSTAADLEPDETWLALLRDLEGFADLTSSTSLVVTSNLRRMFNARALETRFRGAFSDWWGGIQHGFGLSGLTAPLSSAAGFSRLYVASTLNRSVPYPWGSDPLIDDAIRWSGFRAEHDAYDLTRHDKIVVFGELDKRLGCALPLRVCDRARGSERNCGRCEKCCRTMTGLILQEQDPVRHGFPPLVPAHVTQKLTSGAWPLPRGVMSYWVELQDTARTALDADTPGAVVLAHADYLGWLARADFPAFRKRSNRNLRRRVRFVLGWLPKRAIPAFERIRRALGRT